MYYDGTVFLKDQSGENIYVKKVKQKTGTILKIFLILAVVLSGVLGTYAETEVQWDTQVGSTEVSVGHRVFHYKNDCITKERSQDSLHRQEKKKAQPLSWGIPVAAVCAAYWLYTKRAGICSAAAEERERRYDLWKRRGPPLFV